MFKIKFDDKTVTAEEMFELLSDMKKVQGERFPAENVFHCSLRSKDKEKISLQNSISVTARNSDGKLVGFLKLLTDHSYMFYILDVMVHPDYRNNSIAREMIDLTVDYGKKNGFIKIFLTALPGKEKYYESFGFKEGMSPVLTIRGEEYAE